MADIVDQLTERLSDVPEIERIILFGSRARGDHGHRSDIDLAIECPRASNRIWHHIRDIVEHFRTLLFVDLIRLDRASDALKKKVDQEGVVLYER